MSKVIEGSFKAWIDKMPGSGHKLIVVGKIEVPTSGWSSTLNPADPQGINPNVLILNLQLNRPTGIVSQVVSIIDCRFEESPPKHEYSDVTVRHDGEEFTIKVSETQ